MTAQIINLSKFKAEKEVEAEKKRVKIEALERVEEKKAANKEEYNLEFWELVDLFMREHYPEAAWRFDLWLDNIEKEIKK